jgi:hypothetical protein
LPDSTLDVRDRAMIDKLRVKLDMMVWYAIALYALFITLPSLDKSTENADGSTLHPSAGTPGSCYMTRDGQHYVRTGHGTRKVGKAVGEMLIARSKRIRRKAIARRVVAVGTAATIAACLTVLSLS